MQRIHVENRFEEKEVKIKEVWSFIFIDDSVPTLMLSRWERFIKPSKLARSWRSVQHWDRYYVRQNNVEQPHVPVEIQKKVKEQFIKQLIVLDFNLKSK